MLKKLRWRFIAAAMSAYTAVVAVLVGGMNLWNYHIITLRQDEALLRICEMVLEPPAQEDTKQDFPMPGPFGGHSPEFRYMLRFFSVRCDEEGTAIETDREFIASVTKETAAQWGETIAKGRKESGYFQGYRYLKQEVEGGSIILFLNSEQNIQSMQTLLLVSVVVAAGAFIAVFVLVLLFSKRAIAPYVRNIETQKRFITDASHELKTPITAISACVDILKEDVPENEWVETIQSECSRMTRLVNDLVKLSRLDEERPFPDPVDFSLSEAIWEIAEPMQAAALAKGKTYTQSIEDGLSFCGDRAAIQQMVSILLDNAVKYSDEGGAIRLSAQRVNDKIQIEVFNTCDTTVIEDVGRLFDRFYRPDVSRSAQTGGTGVGLSIAKATAEACGGTIRAHAENGGITFTARI